MKKILAVLLLLSPALAAQNIDPTVEVDKDFTGKMMQASKSKLNTAVNDSLGNFNLDFNYTIFDKPYRDLYEFIPMPSAELQTGLKEKLPVFMAKASIGVPVNPQAQVWYNPQLGSRHSLMLDAGADYYSGTRQMCVLNMNTGKLVEFGNRKLYAYDYGYHAGAAYGYSWKGGELSAGVKFHGGMDSYYGFDPRNLNAEEMETVSQKKFLRKKGNGFNHRFSQVEADLSIRSVDARGSGRKFNYALWGHFSHLADRSTASLAENYGRIGVEFGPTFGKYNKLIIRANGELAGYASAADYTTGMIEVIPQYRLDKGRWMLDLGIKLSGNSSSKPDTDKYRHFIFPEVDLNFEVARGSLWVFAGAHGGNNLNLYSALLRDNPYLNPATSAAGLRTSSIPLQIKGGLEGKFTDKFSYRLYASYTIHSGLLQFVKDMESPWFNTLYSNHREVAVAGEITCNYKDFYGGLHVKYSSYTKGRRSTLINGLSPAGYTPVEADLFAEYNWRGRIFARASVLFRSETPYVNIAEALSDPLAHNFKINNWTDLSIGLKYVIDNNFAVFLNGSNLLNMATQLYPFYVSRGIEVNAGIIVKL